MLLYSALRHPIYYPRYLSFTAPAIALLLGLCIVAVGRSQAGVTAVRDGVLDAAFAGLGLAGFGTADEG